MTTPTPAQIEAAITDIDTRMQGKSFAIMTAPEWLIISQAAALTAAAQVGEQDEQISRLIGFTQFDLDKDRKRVEAATIERCAQWLEDDGNRATANAMRKALKDEP